jgi:hypothetical protein
MDEAPPYQKIMDKWSFHWFQYILDHPEVPWNYNDICMNINLTRSVIDAYPDKPWNLPLFLSFQITLNQHPNYQKILKFDNSYLFLDYYMMDTIERKHYNCSWENDVLEDRDFTWNYELLSNNPNITFDIVRNNPEIPWNYYNFNANGDISWEDVRANPDFPWDFKRLLDNPMNNARANFIRGQLQEWFTKSALKEGLMASVWHPRNFHKFRHWDSDVFGDLEE